MKITEVNLSEEITKSTGLGSVKMSRISNTVLLAGKNGSGKTRILNLIRQQAANLHQFLQEKRNADQTIKNLQEQIKRQSQQKQNFELQISQHIEQIKNVEQQIDQQPQQKQNLERQISRLNEQIKNFEQQIDQQPPQKQNLKNQITYLNQKIKKIEQQLAQQSQQKQDHETHITYLNEQIKSYEKQIKLQPLQKEDLERQITYLNQQIKKIVQQIDQQPQQKQDLEREIIKQTVIKDSPVPIGTSDNRQSIAVVDFVPTNLKLEDWSTKPRKTWENDANHAKSLGVANLSKSTLALIQKIQEDWWEADHQNSEEPEEVKKDAIKEYNRLNDLIFEFLNTKLSRSKSYSTLFGRPIAETQLSMGQVVLLQLCIAIYAQGGSLSNHIIFMDEPENHLHPSAVIDLIEKLEKISPESQIWIATHSIPLLSHFDASSLWFVKDGKVTHSGKKPEQVLEGLLGTPERIQKLRDFTSLPDELARNRFAFECLLPPEVVETDSKDPQSLQLNEQLKIIWEKEHKLRLLDFGAGKGRMIANLTDYDNVSSDTLDYHAFDPFDKDKEHCLKNISLSYNDDIDRYHNSIEILKTKINENSFDVVVLSNVLHEIPTNEWCSVMEDIVVLLKEKTGYLLLIEDCRIPMGELPNKNGFLVLNTLHIQKLFEINPEDKELISNDARPNSQKGRLMAHLIPASYLNNISTNTMNNAISELKKTALTEIKKIRDSSSTYSDGLTHSFWVQQLANAQIYLSGQGIN